MVAAYLATAALMGLLVVVVVLALARGPGWYEYTPDAAGEGGGWPREQPTAPGILSRPLTWVVAFVAIALVAVGGVFVVATSGAEIGPTGPPVLVLGGLVLVFLVLGSYLAARDRGHSHAFAVGVASVVTGVLMLIGVASQLLT